MVRESHAQGRETVSRLRVHRAAVLGFAPNDDHPPHDPFNAQRLIAKVYNAIRANAQLWKSTLLVILYDEHGGFADHVVPPPTIAPDDEHAEYTFPRLGLRVPAVLVSPWIARQVVDVPCDHTSLLRSLIEKWGLGPMGARTAQAADIFAALTRAPALRTDTPKTIGLDLPGEQASMDPPTDHQNAVIALGEYIDPTPGLTPQDRADRFFGGVVIPEAP